VLGCVCVEAQGLMYDVYICVLPKQEKEVPDISPIPWFQHLHSCTTTLAVSVCSRGIRMVVVHQCKTPVAQSLSRMSELKQVSSVRFLLYTFNLTSETVQSSIFSKGFRAKISKSFQSQLFKSFLGQDTPPNH